jgi:hypothetical protein
MKIHKPNPKQLTFRKALEQAISDYGRELMADELLAICSHFVGQLIALQDQRVMTPAMAMDLVASNIEQGNGEAINGLLNETGGTA